MAKVLYALLAVVLIGVGFLLFSSTNNPVTEADLKLFEAAHVPDLKGVQDALAAGASVKAKFTTSKWNQWFGKPDPFEGYTALHYGAQMNSVEICELLISKGADINALDFHGNSPLMCAAAFIGTKTVPYLVSKGANLDFVNDRGSTAFDMTAKRMGGAKEGAELGRIIREAGGKAGAPQPGSGEPPPGGGE